MLISRFKFVKLKYNQQLDITITMSFADVPTDELSQQDRAFMRERFLLLMTKLSGRKAMITMWENTTVQCTIKHCDGAFSNLIVKDLETVRPEKIKNSVLRVNDIIAIALTMEDQGCN